MNTFIISNKKISGFTLVEMLIVLGLFSFMMTLATGVLYTTQAINVKLQETQSILDNVNVSMDAMSREIRYGADFHCDTDWGGEIGQTDIYKTLRKSCDYNEGHGGKLLFFKPIDSSRDTDRVAYYASSTNEGEVIMKDEYFSVTPGVLTNSYQITANDVKIKSLLFYVAGANSVSTVGADVGDVHDYVQPLITTTLSGETKPTMSNASSTKFIIQLSVSARSIDK
jgi:prepilin-type N-terminal cleavage/methylation domain-containing protein